MFTTEELQAIDRKYFTVIVADAYDVTLISNNTRHVWYIHNVELKDRNLCLVYHNQDMMKLVELKKDIIRRIKAVESAELQTILELRYLSYMGWEEIAIELGYGIDNVFRLHRNALDEITIPETIQ